MSDETNKNEQPLYQTETKNSFEEFRKFNHLLFRGRFWMSVLFPTVLLAWLAGYAVYLGHRGIGIALCVVIVAFYLYFFLVFPKRYDAGLRKSWDTMGFSKGSSFLISFYEKHFEACVNKQNLAYKYSSIRKIFRTRQNYYLMMAKNEAVIVVKKNCSPELIRFLDGLKKRYHL